MADILNRRPLFTRVRRTIGVFLGQIIKVSTFLVVALVGGLLTSWIWIEKGSTINTERQGAWIKWTAVGRPGTDPYSRSRFTNRELLIFNASYVSRFEAFTDDNGRRLHSSCQYAVAGDEIDAPWWTFTVFDAAGKLIPNAANRHGFNSATVVSAPNGQFLIEVGRDARPGNWVPTGSAGRLIFLIEMHNRAGDVDALSSNRVKMPTIRRLSC